MLNDIQHDLYKKDMCMTCTYIISQPPSVHRNLLTLKKRPKAPTVLNQKPRKALQPVWDQRFFDIKPLKTEHREQLLCLQRSETRLSLGLLLPQWKKQRATNRRQIRACYVVKKSWKLKKMFYFAQESVTGLSTVIVLAFLSHCLSPSKLTQQMNACRSSA